MSHSNRPAHTTASLPGLVRAPSRLVSIFCAHLRVFTIATVIALFASGCAASRPPIPPGEIPHAKSVPQEDDVYGHEVLSQLTEKFKLDHDDNRINRVRDIVDRLAIAADANADPWNVFVLADDHVKNAAATRGNYVFVWTGMMNAVQNDEELATVLAHEMGHVLAGHTQPDPSEEVTSIISGTAGEVAGAIVGQRIGILGDLAKMAVKEGLNAILVNPGQQGKEFEADQIGIFLMARARYNPESAVKFWQRVQTDPDFGSSSLAFLSSHPSSAERTDRLKQFLPMAMDQYRQALATSGKHGSTSKLASTSHDPYSTSAHGKSSHKSSHDATTDQNSSSNYVDSNSSSEPPERWIARDDGATVYTKPSTSSKRVTALNYGTKVAVVERVKTQGERWLRISEPVPGYVKGRAFEPVDGGGSTNNGSASSGPADNGY